MGKLFLHIAIKEAINKFGLDILSEKKLINILLDLGGFNDTPASKVILKEMISDGYCQKIKNLGTRKQSSFFSYKETTSKKPEGEEWKIKIASYSAEFISKKGFESDLVNYVIDCIVYALGWSDVVPQMGTTTKNSTNGAVNSSTPHPLPNTTSSGTNSIESNSVSYNAIEEDSQFVVMKVTPVYAHVFIDGKQQYVSNGIMAAELNIGKHTYEVMADSHQTESGDFTISKDSKTNLDIALELESKKVMLEITTADTDAEIFINGVRYGVGKWKGLVEAGNYEVEIAKPKFISYKELISVDAHKLVEKKFPALKPVVGNLKINIQPYGSEIFINGENKGTTPLLVTGIQIGERIIRVITEEGTEYSASVEVKENQVTDVNHVIPSLFIDDYSHVRIGDYYYEDGSISHEIAKNKTIVGVVFSLETSDEEKRHGWTHGQIIAIENASSPLGLKSNVWGVVTDILSNYTSPNLNMSKDNGYAINHVDCIVNNTIFRPFFMAAKYDAALPSAKTSGWYLPSAKQWMIFNENISFKTQVKINIFDINGNNRTYATCSLMDVCNAWVYRDYGECKIKGIKSCWQGVHVRSVAAF